MKERPIIFSAPMVRAILEGRKTQTRRIIKPERGFEQHNICKPDMAADPWSVWWHGDVTDRVGCLQECPFGKPGDRLWVRETWLPFDPDHVMDGKPYAYGADCLPGSDSDRCRKSYGYKWRPSIHMPRAASRITLEVTGVRVERLQDISEEDAKAEGVEPWQYGPEQTMTTGERGADSPYRGGFACLWDDLHEDIATWWKSNPWVWVLEFSKLAAHSQGAAHT